jgi:hypothetical protein
MERVSRYVVRVFDGKEKVDKLSLTSLTTKVAFSLLFVVLLFGSEALGCLGCQEPISPCH